MSDQQPDPTTDPARIVVGVDGSETSRLALRRAAVEAVAHGARLEVVHAWNYLDQHGPQFDPHYGEDKARANADQLVTETLGADRPADVVITVVNDHAVPALLGAATGALTLVVGARGLGGFKSLMLGSVSHHVIQHASCSVLVVR
ncbi:MAG: universal stress protein [Ilumatobacteraceae bacterium]